MTGLKGNCKNCKKQTTCNKLIGLLSGFCLTDFEPTNPRFEVHILSRPCGTVLIAEGFDTFPAAEDFYNKLSPEQYADLVKTDSDGNYLETLCSNYDD